MANSIPKIIHQTWKSDQIPVIYQSWIEQLKALHPQWEYRFYNDEDCREAIVRNAPELIPIYDNYPRAIQRADMFRVFIVYHDGGFYADLDMQCHKSLDDLCCYSCVVAEEKKISSEQRRICDKRYTLDIANYMFGAVPKHPFIKQLLDELVSCSSKEIDSDKDVLDVTGPGVFTRCYHVYESESNPVFLLASGNKKCTKCQRYTCQFGHYASHIHTGTWREDSFPTAYYQLSDTIYILDTFGPQMYDRLRKVFQKTSNEKTEIKVKKPPNGKNSISQRYAIFLHRLPFPSKPEHLLLYI